MITRINWSPLKLQNGDFHHDPQGKWSHHASFRTWSLDWLWPQNGDFHHDPHNFPEKTWVPPTKCQNLTSRWHLTPYNKLSNISLGRWFFNQVALTLHVPYPATCNYKTKLRVSTDHPANFAPPAAFCAPLNWRMMRQPTCFYSREKVPTVSSPVNLPTYQRCYSKPANYKGVEVEIPTIWDFGSSSIVLLRCHLDAACKTLWYICKTIYFAYVKLYVLCTVYTFAYAKTYTFAKHCFTYAKQYVLLNLWKTTYFE